MQLGQMSLVGGVLLIVGFFTGSFFLCLAAGFIFSYTESNLGDNVGFLKGFSYGAGVFILLIWIFVVFISLLV